VWNDERRRCRQSKYASGTDRCQQNFFVFFTRKMTGKNISYALTSHLLKYLDSRQTEAPVLVLKTACQSIDCWLADSDKRLHRSLPLVDQASEQKRYAGRTNRDAPACIADSEPVGCPIGVVRRLPTDALQCLRSLPSYADVIVVQQQHDPAENNLACCAIFVPACGNCRQRRDETLKRLDHAS
jgi:hypothetical protein